MLKYHLIKDILMLALIGAVIYLGIKEYNNHANKLDDFEKSLTKMGTGISIDNQRKAKIQKATEMILSKNKKLKYEVAMNYAEWFVDEADKYTNVDFVLLLAIASQESGFNDRALSPLGAMGIMQMLPSTAEEVCENLRMSYNDSLLYDAKTNIRLGARYVNKMMTRFNNIEYAISAYNGGPGGGIRYRAYKTGIVGKESVSEENLKYVPAVLGYKFRYEKLL